MSTGTVPERPTVEALPGVRKRWTAEDVRTMVEVGLLAEGSGAFLYNGEIFQPVVETAPWDLGQGLRDYAEALVRRHWVVDIPNREVLVFHPDPDPSRGFSAPAAYGTDGTVPLAPAATPGGPVTHFEGVPVAEILALSLGPRE